MQDTYRPLPKGLKIKDSEVHGQGVFTEVSLEKDWVLGPAYLIYEGKKIRLPIGGFINHSDTPNVEKKEHLRDPFKVQEIITVREISAGEELTINYNDERYE